MTPQEQELVKKLDEEVKNLSILMQGTEVGDSLTLKEIRHLLYELNKGVKEQESKEAEIRETIEKARDILHLNGSGRSESISGTATVFDLQDIVKELSDRVAFHQDYAEKTNEALLNLPSVKVINTNTTQPPY